MKCKKLLVGLILLVLVGCNTTPQSPTWMNKKGYSQGMLSHLKYEAISGGNEARFRLAVYQYLYDEVNRDSAIEMIEVLAEDHFEEAMNLLASIQLSGELGYYTDAAFVKYRPLVQDKHGFILKNEDYLEKTKAYYDAYPQYWNDWYKRVLPLLSDLPFTFPAELTSHQLPHYVLGDLFSRLITENDPIHLQSRLELVSESSKKTCPLMSPEKICLAIGFEILAGKSELDTTDKKHVESLAHTLHLIIQKNESSFAVESPSKSPSLKSSKFILEAAKEYEKGDVKKSVEILQTGYKKIKADKKFDLAYTEKMLGDHYANIGIAENDSPEHLERSLYYLERALARKQLIAESHQQAFAVASGVAILLSDHMKAIGYSIDYFDYSGDTTGIVSNEILSALRLQLKG